MAPANGRAVPRRVTRSQSREPSSYQDEKTSGSPQSTWRGKGKSIRMSPVPEQSPRTSRNGQLSDDDEVINESPDPEGNTNISGTTVIERDFAVSEEVGEYEVEDSEDEGNPTILLEELQGLQDSASNLMGTLVPEHSKPFNIVEAALDLQKRPKTDAGRQRVRRRHRKLTQAIKHFGPGLFIDVPQAQSSIPAVPAHDKDLAWRPTPILHHANCARLAAEVLLTDSESGQFKDLIKCLNSGFPAPFLEGTYSGSIAASNGLSEKTVFDLALEIRTHWFIMELDSHMQREPNTDALWLLKKTFFWEQGWKSLDPHWLRSFALRGTFENENQGLPGRFQDDVMSRFSDLHIELSESSEAPMDALKALKAYYKWNKLARLVAQFLCGRDPEIRSELRNQASLSDVMPRLEVMVKNGEAENLMLEEEPEEPGSQEAFPRHRSASLVNTRDMRDSSQNHESPFQSRSRNSTGNPQSPFVRPLSPQVGTPGPSYSPRKDYRDPSSMKQVEPKRRKSRSKAWLTPADMNYVAGNTKRSSDTRATPQAERSPRVSRRRDERNKVPHTQEHSFDDGETTFINNDMDLRLEEPLEQSTTPPGSARTNQISHGQSSSPPDHDLQRRERIALAASANDTFTPQRRRRDNDDITPRRTLLDHQTGASRVSEIDEDETQSSGPPTEQKGNTSRKRPRESDSDSESDDGFEQDDREIDIAARRAKKPRQQDFHASPRDGSVESETGQQLQQALAESSQIPRSGQQSEPPVERAVEVDIPPRERHSDNIPLLTRLGNIERPKPSKVQKQKNAPHSQAQFEVAGTSQAVPSSTYSHYGDQRPREEKKSGRFTQEEDERLIELKATCSWAEILKIDRDTPSAQGGQKLRGRTNVQLKDRARSLVTKWQRTGERIPPGFEGVKPDTKA